MEKGLANAFTVRLRLLANPYLWSWDIEDATGRRIESSWEDRLDAFVSSEEALNAALARLAQLSRPGGVRVARPALPARPS